MIDHSQTAKLEEQYPGRMGYLLSPDTARGRQLPLALDNGRFPVWMRGKPWDADKFRRHLDKFAGVAMWACVPDVVTDAVVTLDWWHKWLPEITGRGLTPALVVQDGMTPEHILGNINPPVVFVGGSTEWKRRTLWKWCRMFNRVHCGRVNTERWLWHADKCGCESVDGTGWFRGDQAQLRGLHRYLGVSSGQITNKQKELAFANTFKAASG